MANNKNKSNYLLYAVLAIAFICGVLGVIAFVWEITGKCKKTSKTTGKGSGEGYVENFRQSPYQIKEKFDLNEPAGAWSAAKTIKNVGTGAGEVSVCNEANLPNTDYLVQQNVMDDTGANSKDYTCQEFTLDGSGNVSGQGWFVGCQRPSDMLAPLYVAVAKGCNPEGNVSNAVAFQTGGTCSGVSNTTSDNTVTINQIATYFGKINSSGTGIDQTTLNQFTYSLDTLVAIWNATIGAYTTDGTPRNPPWILKSRFYKTSASGETVKNTKYYKYTNRGTTYVFASAVPLKSDFSQYPDAGDYLNKELLDNASWEPDVNGDVTDANKGSKLPSTLSTATIVNIKDEDVTYEQFQQAFRKMLYANGTGAYGTDACLGSSVGSS